MDSSVQKFFAARDEYRTASQRAFDRRDGICLQSGKKLEDAMAHPDCKALYEIASRLYWKMDALSSHLIRANLENLGLTDMVATGVLKGRNGNELGRAEMLLSDLCGLRYHGLAKKLEIEVKDADMRITIEVNGTTVGEINSDGLFNFNVAPDIRTALGWRIATDGGREYLIQFFDLDQAARFIVETIRMKGTSQDAFFDSFSAVLKSVFVFGRTSRFSDGYCGAKTLLWRMATREVGEEHGGYPFAY